MTDEREVENPDAADEYSRGREVPDAAHRRRPVRHGEAPPATATGDHPAAARPHGKGVVGVATTRGRS